MPKLKIIHKHLLKTFAGPFFVSLFFFTVIILIFYLKEILKLAIEKRQPLDLIAEILLHSTTWTLTMTVPIAILMGTIMAIGALNNDSEIIAMRAGGINFYQIFKPFLVIGLLLAGFFIWFNATILPYSFKNMEILKKKISRADPISILNAGRFTVLDKTKDLERIIYFEKENKDKKSKNYRKLENIQIRETVKIKGIFKLNKLIIAKTAERIKKKRENYYIKALRLENGYIFNHDFANNSLQKFDFRHGTFDINLFSEKQQLEKITIDTIPAFTSTEIRTKLVILENKIKSLTIKPSAKTSKSLVQANLLSKKKLKKKEKKYNLELFKRFASSFSALAFFIIAFPLGITNARSGKGLGLGLSVVIFFIYYILYLSAEALVLYLNVLTPLIAAWLPIIVIASLGFLIFHKKTNI